uniref:Uncharacterized protein n=1 Tax=Pseudomonas aeruginosa TaxID=287 RepID=A0A6C0L5T2_PSEAI|nr:hypothetical protein [Pseudomonas aeruginosa]
MSITPSLVLGGIASVPWAEKNPTTESEKPDAASFDQLRSKVADSPVLPGVDVKESPSGDEKYSLGLVSKPLGLARCYRAEK